MLKSAVEFAQELAGDVKGFRMWCEIDKSFARKRGLDVIAELEARVEELRDAWPELVRIEGENLGLTM
jgi:hypothetical protein